MAYHEEMKEWNLSPEYGMLLNDALEYLPSYFDPWNNLAKELIVRAKNNTLRGAVKELPLLDDSKLTGYKEDRLAHLQLSFITSGYVWQDGDAAVPLVLPQQLAVPLYNVSKRLGVAPCMNHSSLAGCNWALIDKHGLLVAENLRSLYRLAGDEQSNEFITVAVEVESKLARSNVSILNALDACQDHDDDTIIVELDKISESISEAVKSMGKYHTLLDPVTFFERIRPFVFGWGGKDSPLPDGLIYEGVSDKPLKVNVGGTSAMLKPLDALLGTKLDDACNAYHERDRAYIFPEHLAYIDFVKNKSTLPEYVKSSTNQRLINAFENCESGLLAFRMYHTNIARKYIMLPSERETRSKKYVSQTNSSPSGVEAIPILERLIKSS